MSGRLIVPPDAVEAQRRASDPALSAWVAANAGSGKTYVLARRVVRLMLAGTPPGAILCLTFTKAAAATIIIGPGRPCTRDGVATGAAAHRAEHAFHALDLHGRQAGGFGHRQRQPIPAMADGNMQRRITTIHA